MATPEYLKQGVKTGFAMAWREFAKMSGPDAGLLNIALKTQSDSKEEDYGWMGSVPAASEFLSEAGLEQLTDYEMTLRNKDWVAAVHIRKSNFKDDKTGSAQMIGRQLAVELAKKPANLIEDMLIDGDSGTAYDSVAFFSNASGVRVNDNLLAGTGATVALVKADLISARQAMRGFKDDQGKYLNLTFDTIVCGEALEGVFEQILNSTTDPTASVAGIYNPFGNGKVQLIVSSKIGADDTYDWYACASQGILKPFIAQSRENPKIEIEDRPTLPSYAIVATSRGNVGYGLPHLAVKVVNT